MMDFKWIYLAAVLLVQISRNRCLGNTFDTIGNKEIRLFHIKANYAEATQLCREWGNDWLSENTGKLVSISNHEEQSCVNKLITSSISDSSLLSRIGSSSTALEPGYFAGARYANSRNTWVWQNDQEVQYTNWVNPEKAMEGSKQCFQFLMKNSSNSEEQQYLVGQWQQVTCESKKFYICEREIQPSLQWGYENNHHAETPDQWPRLYESCGGDTQSPINFPVTSVPKCNSAEEGRLVRGWRLRRNQNVKWIVENTGRFIKITPSPPRSMWTTFIGTRDKYYVNYMVLKWGNNSTMGSEHSVDGWHSEGELQVFHHPVNGDPSSEIHALSYLFQDGYEIHNSHWDDLLNAIRHVRDANQSYEMNAPSNGVRQLLQEGVTPMQVFEHLNYVQHKAFRYRGSLPHPPCSENVIWTVFPRPISLATSQFSLLRQLRMEGNMRMTNNFRPTQHNNSPICSLNRV